ncbi:uncharacterized protein LOC134802099 [Cydia splendana]|uniref:uncharacterized protein LOC134802099 n=1 Tax=Cydia splendana TaxID=1100963 RepID=UPI00300D5516
MTTLVFILLMVRAVWSQQWDPKANGDEDTYMQFTAHWKKEIVMWARECIAEIRGSVYQTEQIQWVAADDLRHSIGMTMGRILELHRHQVDMYRRMKRVVEGQFTWLRPEQAGAIPQLGPQSGVVEPGVNTPFKPKLYDQKWASGQKKTYQDYKPHIYMFALEYITKKETEIEHLVKLLTTYTAENEVARFKPHMLPVGQAHWAVWTGYTTERVAPREGQYSVQGVDTDQKTPDRMKKTENTTKKKRIRQKCGRSIIKRIEIIINKSDGLVLD